MDDVLLMSDSNALWLKIPSQREDQFKLEEFKKFLIATHESGVQHKEDSYDQMLFKDLVRKFLLQQRNQAAFESSEIDSRVIHSPDSLQDSHSQGASSIPSAEGASSSDQGIPHPPGLPQPQEPQVRRRITGKQPPSEVEVNMITSLKQRILEINDYSVNSDQSEEDQELQLLQDLKELTLQPPNSRLGRLNLWRCLNMNESL